MDSLLLKAPLSVNYDRDLETLVKDCRFAWRSPDANAANFPRERTGEIERRFREFRFNRLISSEEIIVEMNTVGWEPAGPIELLTYLVSNSEGSKAYPLVALKRGRNGDVLRVWRNRESRGLSLGLWALDWTPSYSFLAVHTY